eukprot:983311-Karenia_brevis.AAC.1
MTVAEDYSDPQPDPADPYEAETYGADGFGNEFDPGLIQQIQMHRGQDMNRIHLTMVQFQQPFHRPKIPRRVTIGSMMTLKHS